MAVDTQEPATLTSITPSGIEIRYSPKPRRMYEVRWVDIAEVDWVEVPSVTTVLGVLDKSGALTWWGQGVGVEAVLELVVRGRLKWVESW